jgi:hypothetical protein
MKAPLLTMVLVAGCAAGPSEVAMPNRGTITPSLLRGQLLDPTVTRIAVTPPAGSAATLASADAALAAERVRESLRDHMHELHRCYAWRANRVRGDVDLRFRIDGDGRAHDVRARGITQAMSSCVRELVTRIPFEVAAEPGVDVALRLPFFERGGPHAVAAR